MTRSEANPGSRASTIGTNSTWPSFIKHAIRSFGDLLPHSRVSARSFGGIIVIDHTGYNRCQSLLIVL